MISVRHRFHGSGGLKKVYSAGQTVRSPHISVKYLARPAGRSYRAAVVVSRKVDKSAVVRNRIRRRIYEVIRQTDKDLLLGKDLVFTVFNSHVATMEASELSRNIKNLLQKTNITSAKDHQTPVRHAIVNNNAKKQGK